MDSIKSKMMSLSQATMEATARAEVFSEEMQKTQEIADKYEEQVGFDRFLQNTQISVSPHSTSREHLEKSNIVET